MERVAFMFPGQGAQYLGMGKSLYENFNEVKVLFDSAGNALGQDIASLCFEGPVEELRKTENTQPAILTVSIAVANVLMSNGIKPVMAAGLSLGEYSALVAAGAIEFADAVSLVRKRAQFIQQAVPMGVGGMAVIVGLNKEQVEECCREGLDFGMVQPANYNSPCQIVISGHNAALEKACEAARAMNAKQVLMLPVSAPFHSSLLDSAAKKLANCLSNFKINKPRIDVISNVTARPYESASEIPAFLEEQVSHPVRWDESVMYMINQGIEVFVEVGPGKTLSGLLRKISRNMRVYNVEDRSSLENTLNRLIKGVA